MNQPTRSATRDLFVFIDESGNFDFSASGTKHFVMAGIATLAAECTGMNLLACKYELLAAGTNINHFHASEDRQSVRDAVFRSFSRMQGLQCHAVSVSKDRVTPAYRTAESLHALLGRRLLENLLAEINSSDFDRITVIIDQSLPQKRQGVFHEVLKPYLKQLGKPFQLHFQSIKFDPNGQLADYVAWSKYVEVERQELRPWLALRAHVGAIESDVSDDFRRISDRPD